MKRLVHTLALGAALVALAIGVWRDYGAFTAIKRSLTSYLVAYFLAGGLGLAARAAIQAVRDPDPEPEPEKRPRKRARRRRFQAAEPELENVPVDEPAAPEPVETT